MICSVSTGLLCWRQTSPTRCTVFTLLFVVVLVKGQVVVSARRAFTRIKLIINGKRVGFFLLLTMLLVIWEVCGLAGCS
jgi:hypothetical protein